jgi:hypothetical protein
VSVLLPNTTLGVARRGIESEDAHGDLIRGEPEPMVGPWPGRVRERADGTWSLALDVAAWPVKPGDFIVDPTGGHVYLVATAERLTNDAVDDVDYVRVEARERRQGGTESPESTVNEPTPADTAEVPLAVALQGAWSSG